MKKPMLIAIGAALGLLFLTVSIAFAEALAAPSADDPLGTAELLLASIKAGKWLAAAGVLLVLLVWGLRKVLPRAHKWFGSKAGGWAINFVTSAAALVGASLFAGVALTPAALLVAVTSSFAAAGGWEGFRDFSAWLLEKLK